MLRCLLLSPPGSLLSNEAMCNMMQSCFRIVFEQVKLKKKSFLFWGIFFSFLSELTTSIDPSIYSIQTEGRLFFFILRNELPTFRTCLCFCEKQQKRRWPTWRSWSSLDCPPSPKTSDIHTLGNWCDNFYEKNNLLKFCRWKERTVRNDRNEGRSAERREVTARLMWVFF